MSSQHHLQRQDAGQMAVTAACIPWQQRQGEDRRVSEGHKDPLGKCFNTGLWIPNSATLIKVIKLFTEN